MGEHPTLPDYWGRASRTSCRRCSSRAIPRRRGCPDPSRDADQVVLLVVDGLGWDQLQDRLDRLPHLGAMAGSPISTVVPSTTATAMTSLTTGLPPGEHGVIGYRIHVEDEVLNVLRWSTPAGDARKSVPPHELQPVTSFRGHHPPW
ncbi:MAG: alkaline phosphatase family protein [Acidimicrobiia bacterium]|nr:alkaline phosphatase family protein [Acidimicrobiia bacterium]